MFPTYEEYRRFLAASPAREFEQGCYYRCAMAILGQGPVAEGYSSDIDMDAPDWFGEHERRAKDRGMWSGKTPARAVLEMLLEIDPEGCYPLVTRDRSANLRRAQTVQIGGWRVRFDVTEPSAQFLANFAQGTQGPLIEGLFDVALIGGEPYSIEENGTLRGSSRFGQLGKGLDKTRLAGAGAARTRHLRAYRVS